MIGFVRKIVAGPKNRTHWKGVDLDLTYITQRIIAMAYPASGFEKTYRNSIHDVSEYFKEKHLGNCLVINVSMRSYDYKLFGNMVKDYFWPDHQAPPLTTIFIICNDMLQFLQKSKDGVVAAHCNHGKGRTGTTIIAFMLVARQFDTADDALTFYNKKRFIVDTYGVDQPCQRRYLDYVQRILHMQKIQPNLKAFKLVKILQSGLNVQDYYVQISLTRTCETKHTKLKLNQILKNSMIPLIGDIFIEIYANGWTGQSQAVRINYNLNFLQTTNNGLYIAQFKSENIKVNGKEPRNFSFSLFFQEFCKCYKQININCQCFSHREREQKQWQKLIWIVEKSKKISNQQLDSITYGSNKKKYESEIVEQCIKIEEPIPKTNN